MKIGGQELIGLTLARRPDGGLRVTSDTYIGLILSGSDPVKVMSDVWPALCVLEEYKAAQKSAKDNQA